MQWPPTRPGWYSWKFHFVEAAFITSFVSKFNLLKIIIDFIEEQILLITKPNDYIFLIEVKLVKHLRDKGFICNALDIFRTSEYNYCPFSQPLSVNKWILDKRYFAIKWKYVANYLKYIEINNKYLNYLMRYLKTGKIIHQIPNHFKLIV